MKIKIATFLLAGCAASSAAVITLQNGDFQGSGNDTIPADWTSSETAANNGVYVYASGGGIPVGTNVLAFHGRPDRWVQQAFQTSEATAESFPGYTISFDSGWRNNSNDPNDLSLVFSIYNITEDSVIASETYTFPSDQPSNGFNSYRVIATGNELTINFDNSDPTIAGNTIGLRITSQSSQDSFNPTGWIDNVSITAIPEPSSALLLSFLGLAGLTRRRR